MEVLHPLLNTMMIEHGYGRVLSRTSLPLRIRELCVLAVLAGQSVAPQLTSHMRGAIKCGATPEEVKAVISQTHLAWGKEAQEVADAVHEGCVRGSKAAL
mmetsp:Transcript_15397/g.35600  ORF Transcript_15397/g.35600 Transcript_15397/m.35600 type:complete len:100 (-) Transcript_15397:57-356(-)